MSINGIYNQKKIDLVKLNLASSAKKASSNKTPEYLKMTGSIFNAPNIKDSSSQTISDLNQNKSFEELHQKPSDKQDTNVIDSVASGKAAMKDAQKQGDRVKSLTAETQHDEKTAQNYSDLAQNISKKLVKDDKKFKLQLNKEQEQIKKDNDNILKLTKETEETQKEIIKTQHDLDELLSSSSFSINGSNKQGSNANLDKIEELQNKIGTKLSLVQSNGTKIYALQRSSSRAFAKLNKTNNNYVKINKQNIKGIKRNESNAEKIANTATKVEQISMLTAQVGQTVNLAGKGLVALGSSMSALCGLGSALIATGQVMQKVGTVVEITGNYGQTAANVTKATAFAASGNLQAAMQSAAGAVQTGAAAIKSTKAINKTFDQINSEANQAAQNLAAKSVARETVKNMSEEELGGLSKKEAKRAIKNDLLKQMQETEENSANITTKKKWAGEQVKDLKSQMTNGENADIAKKSFDGVKKSYQEKVQGNLEKNLKNRNLEINEKGQIIDKDTNQVAILTDEEKKIIKKTKQQGSSSINSKYGNVSGSNKKINWSKLAKGFQSSAAMMMNTQQQMQNQVAYAPQWDLGSNSKFQRIHNYNHTTRRHAVHA